MKNVYFLADAHLGSWAIPHGRMQERRVVSFLDSIKEKAAAVYMLGDMFDFWHEYRYVVPKGYTRLLGKISELTDAGVEVHSFCGNHDLWQHDYFERECGMVLHRHNEVVEIGDKTFFLGHGDGLNREDGKEPPYQGEDKEDLVIFAKDYLKTHPDINFFVFGHRHIELDLMLTHSARIVILGDWISHFTYAEFDGEHLSL